MDAFGLCFLFGFMTGTSMWLRYRRLRGGRLRQQIENTTCLRIGDLAAGSVGVRGRVSSPSRTVRAPVSGDEVVGYRVRVVQKQFNRYGHRSWKLVMDACELADRFSVVDPTGKVVVTATSGFALFLKPGFTRRATHPEAVPLRLQAFLASRGQRLQDDFFGLYEVEWYEATIRDSQSVNVFGRADRLPDPSGPPTMYRHTPTQLVIRTAGAYSLVLADRGKAELIRTLVQRESIRGLP